MIPSLGLRSDAGFSLVTLARVSFSISLAASCAMNFAPRLQAQSWISGSGGSISYTGGRVGIGTSTPQQSLDVLGGIYFGSSGGMYSGMLGYGNGDIYLTSGSGNGFSFAPNNGGPTMRISTNGNVGIGTTNPAYKLSVAGTVQAYEVLVNTGWSDYVFDPAYRLPPLRDVAQYIAANRHLPDIPSAAEVQQGGVGVGQMESKLLAKIEELTLHAIQAEERSDRLERQNRDLQERLARLEARLAAAPREDRR